MRAFAAVVVVFAGAACSDRSPRDPPRDLRDAPAAPRAESAVEAAVDADAHEDAHDDGKDHRALYVDRVAVEVRNFVVDAAGALDDRGADKPCPPATPLPMSQPTSAAGATGGTWRCAVVDGKGLLVGGADGSLHFSANNDGRYVVVRDPRE